MSNCVLMAICLMLCSFQIVVIYIQVPVKGGEPIMLSGKEVGYVRRTGDGKHNF